MSQADEQRATNIKQSDDAPELAARLNDTPEVEGHFRSRLTDEDEGLDMSGGAEGFRR